VILWLVACAGESADTAGPAAEPTLTNVQSTVFDASCAFSTCHGEGGGNAGLSLLPGESWAELVGVAAEGDADGVPDGETRVIAGDPDGSYLVKKLEGAEGIVGDTMPQSSPLDAERLQLVRDWIESGALDD
jgi:hypothetical protein